MEHNRERQATVAVIDLLREALPRPDLLRPALPRPALRGTTLPVAAASPERTDTGRRHALENRRKHF